MTLVQYSFNVAVAVLSTAGIFGNIIVVLILVYYKNLRKKMTTTLILNQSVVDLTCSVFLLITYSYEAESPLQVYTSIGDGLVCLLLDAKYLVFCSLNASNLCLVVITLERYLMIVHPIMHRNWITKPRLVAMATCAWVLGFAWNTGPTIPFVYVKDGRCVLFRWPDRKLQSTFGVVYSTGTFLVPVFFFIVAYSHMLIVLSKRVTQVAGETNTNKLSNAQVNVTKTMVVVTAVFLVCWTPNQIYYLLFNLGFNLRLGSPEWLVTQYLCFINCCCNPFIYAFKYDGVRSVLRKKMNNFRGQIHPGNDSTLHTASS
ncbi:hypothetical protein CAPTEDRAFT_127027 [Capitella teleta]|uniref:G-protein coupled receptors family 1 profile domain-containing protein n=1 Tax=Capitella teleta TaxID=283909 RepID=R7TKN1_CAPTE|nr:hypothetical protein CAPTEDRAFT_127027 [Capitella teleta]|eukprot:ELT94259.1 hypothetical protein CAPTEDRAFT_127027 [Capitella teleta]